MHQLFLIIAVTGFCIQLQRMAKKKYRNMISRTFLVVWPIKIVLAIVSLWYTPLVVGAPLAIILHILLFHGGLEIEFYADMYEDEKKFKFFWFLGIPKEKNLQSATVIFIEVAAIYWKIVLLKAIFL